MPVRNQNPDFVKHRPGSIINMAYTDLSRYPLIRIKKQRKSERMSLYTSVTHIDISTCTCIINTHRVTWYDLRAALSWWLNLRSPEVPSKLNYPMTLWHGEAIQKTMERYSKILHKISCKEEQNYICQNKLLAGKVRGKLIMPWSTGLDCTDLRLPSSPRRLGSQLCHGTTN